MTHQVPFTQTKDDLQKTLKELRLDINAEEAQLELLDRSVKERTDWLQAREEKANSMVFACEQRAKKEEERLRKIQQDKVDEYGELHEVRAAIESAKTQLADVRSSLDECASARENVREELRLIHGEIDRARSVLSSIVQEAQDARTLMEKENEEISQELSGARSELTIRQEALAERERLLDGKAKWLEGRERDLAIHRARLRKVYVKALGKKGENLV